MLHYKLDDYYHNKRGDINNTRHILYLRIKIRFKDSITGN